MLSDTLSIKTTRLCLRPYRLEDLKTYHAIFSEYNVVKMTETIPWPFTLEKAHERLVGIINTDPHHEQEFGIFQNDHLIGGIGLHRLTKKSDVGDTPQNNETPPLHHFSLGYHLSEKYWGQGYASEAAIAMLEWADKKWEKPIFISAGHYEDNPASGKVLEKAGFTQTKKTNLFTAKPEIKTLFRLNMNYIYKLPRENIALSSSSI